MRASRRLSGPEFAGRLSLAVNGWRGQILLWRCSDTNWMNMNWKDVPWLTRRVRRGWGQPSLEGTLTRTR